MPLITVAVGALLISLGLIGYFALGRQSVTALIPAFVGVPLVLCGALAMKPNWRKHAMHVAVVIGLIGFLGTVPGVIKAIQWMAGTEPARPAAVTVQTIMAVVMGIFVALCVRSFIAARRARQAGFPVA